MSVPALEDQMAEMENTGGNNAAPPPASYFDFDALPDDVQLYICKWLKPPALNNVRRVDRKRRQLINSHPKFFEEQRLISEAIVRSSNSLLENETIRKIEMDLVFTEYCNCCHLYQKASMLFFIDDVCVAGRRICECRPFHLQAEWELPAESPLMGVSLQECTILYTKGARIGTIRFEFKLMDNLIDALGHLIESSNDVTLECDWESSEVLKRILYEKSIKSLHWVANEEQVNKAVTIIDDEFFLNIGPKTFILEWEDAMRLTDDQLSLVFGREELNVLGLSIVEGITFEGIRRAIQVLLLGNLEMRIEFYWLHPYINDELSALTAKIGLETIECAEEENEVGVEEEEEENERNDVQMEEEGDEEEAEREGGMIIKKFTYTVNERKVVLKVQHIVDDRFYVFSLNYDLKC